MTSNPEGFGHEEGPSLDTRAKRSAAWMLSGQVVTRGLRLLSHIILARLLFPEAFGLMAIVGVFLHGLEMFSDVGIGQSIIQNKRGEEAAFLNTVWTMQVARGCILSVAALFLSWPISVFYGYEELAPLLAVSGLAAFIQGFFSTAMFTERRKLNLGSIIRLDLMYQIFGATITVAWAVVYPSVWSLVGGSLIGAVFRTILSHTYLPGFKHRFQWDKGAAKEVFRFGSWIFLSSALSFIAIQGDRLLLGHYLGLATLGMYAVALRIANALNDLQTSLTRSVLFPYFSEKARSQPDKLAATYYRIRLWIELLVLPASAILMVAGSAVVDLLYDDRYSEAGWMLQVLAVQTALTLIVGSQESLLFSKGRTYFGFARSLVKTVWIVVGIPISWELQGLGGVLWCVALVELPAVLVVGYGMVNEKLLRPIYELRAILIWGGSLIVAWAVLRDFL